MEREWASIQKHLDKADKRLEASRLLFEKGFLEDSISRAYYAMYYAARAVLMLKELSPKAEDFVSKIKEFLEKVRKGEIEVK